MKNYIPEIAKLSVCEKIFIRKRASGGTSLPTIFRKKPPLPQKTLTITQKFAKFNPF